MRNVDLRIGHLDAQGRGACAKLAGVRKLLRRMDQRLGRDAANVQTGAAQAGPFGQYRRNAQLPGADGGHVAAGAATPMTSSLVEISFIFLSSPG